MKEYRGPSGDRRLWYEPDEIEEIMLDELHRAGLVPNGEQDNASVDIEAFVETHLGLSFDLSAELDTDVLGATDFIPGHRPKISVNRDLTGSALDEEDATPGLIGRWRATVAHEASHVLLHRLLYELDDMQRGLFESDGSEAPPQQLFRCLKRDVGFSRPISDWREIQANMGMGALLMPKPVFRAAFDQSRTLLGVSGRPIIADSAIHVELVALLARRFTVSQQATRIRLSTLKLIHSADQPPL